jgi:hypothetical protein
MSASRAKTQEDFDLDRMIGMLDEAVMSDDPRVQECLRRLMVTVALTRPESRDRLRGLGPLRQVLEDVRNLNRRLERLEHEVQKSASSDPWQSKKHELDMIKARWMVTPPAEPLPLVGQYLDLLAKKDTSA